jgi:predicted nucleic acid-binding protein
MRPRGRPPLPRGVWSIEDETIDVPDEVVLDTSFVVDALIVSQPLHGSCLAFLLRLVEAETSITFSRLLEIELYEATFQLALKERHPRDWRRFRHDGRARPRANRLLADVSSSWQTVLEYVDYERVDIAQVADRIPDLMTRYALASYDAIHVATAIESEIRGVVTLDAGFAAVPASELTLYVDPSRLAACRARRARRR